MPGVRALVVRCDHGVVCLGCQESTTVYKGLGFLADHMMKKGVTAQWLRIMATWAVFRCFWNQSHSNFCTGLQRVRKVRDEHGRYSPQPSPFLCFALRAYPHRPMYPHLGCPWHQRTCKSSSSDLSPFQLAARCSSLPLSSLANTALSLHIFTQSGSFKSLAKLLGIVGMGLMRKN